MNENKLLWPYSLNIIDFQHPDNLRFYYLTSTQNNSTRLIWMSLNTEQ